MFWFNRFSDLGKFLGDLNIYKVGGIVFDLGVSSPQLDKKNRGFSFKLDGPLDMRMSCEGPTAQKFLDEVEENTLANIIFELGDEVCAGDLAGRIHTPETPWKAPVDVTFDADGLVLCKRVPGRVEPGDCVFHLGTDYID